MGQTCWGPFFPYALDCGGVVRPIVIMIRFLWGFPAWRWNKSGKVGEPERNSSSQKEKLSSERKLQPPQKDTPRWVHWMVSYALLPKKMTGCSHVHRLPQIGRSWTSGKFGLSGIRLRDSENTTGRAELLRSWSFIIHSCPQTRTGMGSRLVDCLTNHFQAMENDKLSVCIAWAYDLHHTPQWV